MPSSSARFPAGGRHALESPLGIGRRRLRLAQQGIQQFVGLFRFGVFGQPAAGGLLLRGRAIVVEEVSHLFFIHNRLFLPYIRTTGPHCVTGNENQAKKSSRPPTSPARSRRFAPRTATHRRLCEPHPLRRKSATGSAAAGRVAPPHPFSPAPNKKNRLRRISGAGSIVRLWRHSTSSAAARIESGCSTRFDVDISICHLQVSQSVATTSQPVASICRNSPSPMACEVS